VWFRARPTSLLRFISPGIREEERTPSRRREGGGLHAADQRACDAQMPGPTVMQGTEVRMKAVTAVAGEGP
jgi:hypothetical protein